MTSDKLAEVERQVREEMQAFAADVLRPHANDADRLGGLPPALVGHRAVLDLMRGFVPLQFGGGWRSYVGANRSYDLASSARLRAAAAEEAAQISAGLYAALPGPSLTAPIVGAAASAGLRERFFASFCGDAPRWAAFAMTEPTAGSDVGGMRTTATVDGHSVVLSGRKAFIGSAARADWFVVFATDSVSRGTFPIKAYLVERKTPGLSIGEVMPTMGMCALQIASVVMTDCRIPAGNELVMPGVHGRRVGAFVGGLRTFQAFRPVVAAFAIGVGRGAVTYAERLASAQGASHALARRWSEARRRLREVSARLDAGRAMYLLAAAKYDEGLDCIREAATAKAFAAQTALDAVGAAMDVVGFGAVHDETLTRLFRDVLAFDILEGTGEMMRLTAGRALAAQGLAPVWRPAIGESA